MRKKSKCAPLKCQLAFAGLPLFLMAVTSFTFVPKGRAGTYTFSNTNAIPINDSGSPPTEGDPYPSSISVSGLSGETISHLTITLSGLSHSFPSDLDIVLAGPGGQTSMLMSEVGGNSKLPVSNLTLTLDDSAADSLPIDSMLTSGIFKPTRQLPTLPFDFPSPAPAGSSSAPAALSIFDGADPDGVWNLFVVDESSPDSGTISLGWSMNISTVPEPGVFAMSVLGLICLAATRCRRKTQDRREGLKSNLIRTLLAGFSICGILDAPAAKANSVKFFFGPGGTSSLMATFEDSSPNEVQLTINALGLSGANSVRSLCFNLNPELDAQNLIFTEIDSLGGIRAAVDVANDSFKVTGGSGKFDINLDFSQSSAFVTGDSVTYSITGITGLSADDFLFLETPASGHTPEYAAGSLQEFSGLVFVQGTPETVPDPEPTFALLAMSLAGIGLASRKSLSKWRHANGFTGGA